MSARLLPLASLHDVTLLRSPGPRLTKRFTITVTGGMAVVTDPSADLGLTRGEWAGKFQVGSLAETVRFAPHHSQGRRSMTRSGHGLY